MRPGAAAAGLALIAALALSPVSAAADSPGLDSLVPQPQGAGWDLAVAGSGPQTQAMIYGPNARVAGFKTAFQDVWLKPNMFLQDRVEQFDSVFAAAFRLGLARGAAQHSAQHRSFRDVAGLGPSAYEVIDPPDSRGYEHDTIVFTRGDYLALVALGANPSGDPSLVEFQAQAQYNLLPPATSVAGDFRLGAILVLGVVAMFVLIAAGAVVTVVLATRRRAPAAVSSGVPAGAYRSPDGHFWWDGTAWRPVPGAAPPPG